MRSRVKFLLLFVAFFSLFDLNAQKIVSGVKLGSTLTVEGNRLTLNGAGIREKFWIDLYVGSLYLTSKSSDPKEIIESEEIAAIKIDVVSGIITSDKLISAIDDGFENATGGKIDPIRDRIKTFKSFLEEKINKKDTFMFVYIPDQGTIVYKNGVKKGVVKGHDFKKALFGIWLCNKPADKDLKKDMLGN